MAHQKLQALLYLIPALKLGRYDKKENSTDHIISFQWSRMSSLAILARTNPSHCGKASQTECFMCCSHLRMPQFRLSQERDVEITSDYRFHKFTTDQRQGCLSGLPIALSSGTLGLGRNYRADFPQDLSQPCRQYHPTQCVILKKYSWFTHKLSPLS